MHDIWLTRESSHTLMGLARKVERLGDEIYFLTVTRREVIVQQFLERFIDELLIGFFLHFQFFHIHIIPSYSINSLI